MKKKITNKETKTLMRQIEWKQNKELKDWIYYASQMKCGYNIYSHTSTGWKATKSRSLLFLKKELGFNIINAGFDHNAIPVNVNDIEEIYNLIIDNILQMFSRKIH